MKRSNILLLIAVFFKSTFCFAQSSVHIEYNFLDNEVTSISYVTDKNDTIIGSKGFIKVKHETPLTVTLKNFNNEALEAQSVIRKNSFVVAEGATSFGGFLNAFSVLVNPALGIDLGKLLGRGRGVEAAEEQALQVMFPDFSVLEPEENENGVLKYDALIKTQMAKISSWRSASNDLNKLRYNLELTKNQIIKSADEVLKNVSEDAPNTFLKSETRNTVAKIAQENYDYLNLSMKAYKRALGAIDTTGMSPLELYRVELIQENLKKYQDLITESLSTELNQLLMGLVDSYEAINHNTFETILNLVIEENANLFSIDVYPKSSENHHENQNPIKSKSISIKSPGNIIFSNTLGVSFIGFLSPQKEYFLDRNSRIIDVKGDAILPTPTLFMNFFKPSDKRVKIGGNFGIGVPLAEKKAIHFQLGPSLLLGKQSPISINLGIVTGRVARLGGGFKVGDMFSQGPAIPIIQRYELGYQFGISFNMANGLNKAFNGESASGNN